MNADDAFNTAVAIAREIVDELPLGEKLIASLRARDVDVLPWEKMQAYERQACTRAVSEFVAPYLQRIAELTTQVEKLGTWERFDGIVSARIAKLEAENKALRDAGKVVADSFDPRAESEPDDRVVRAALDVLRGAS